MGLVQLSKPQMVLIFGWLNFRAHLTWEDVIADEKLTFEYLTRQCGIPVAQLYVLQPDVTEWVKNGRVKSSDAPRMTQWPLHPVTHCGMDLADIMQTQWSADEMLRVGIDFPLLIELGMTPTIMKTFGLSLLTWQKLGLQYNDIQKWSDSDLHKVFHVGRAELAGMLARRVL